MKRCFVADSGFKFICPGFRRDMDLVVKTENFGEDFLFRRLEKEDYSKGYFDVLSCLTDAADPGEEEFQKRLDFINQRPESYAVVVVENLTTGRIEGTGTLFVEYKFIRKLASVGHIEDIAVDEKSRGAGLGKQLLSVLVELSRGSGCYKTILACSKENEGFYQKCGFEAHELEMAFYH